ncbi:hypothetical protein [Kordia sp.]|uniref:hypothetical protein n=1 Tax=Kordia sp. TaxID=1965332 RepID=UPI003D6BC073
MNYYEIDIDASLKKRKLIYKRKGLFATFMDLLFVASFEVIVTIIFPFIAIAVFINNFDDTESFFLDLLLVIVSLLTATYICLSFFFNNRLQQIKGVSGSKNRTIIKEYFKDLVDWKQVRQDQLIYIFEKGWDWTSLSYGRQITILYDGKDILINCISFTKYRTGSPFSWFFDRKIEKKLKQVFLEKLAKN